MKFPTILHLCGNRSRKSYIFNFKKNNLGKEVKLQGYNTERLIQRGVHPNTKSSSVCHSLFRLFRGCRQNSMTRALLSLASRSARALGLCCTRTCNLRCQKILHSIRTIRHLHHHGCVLVVGFVGVQTGRGETRDVECS